MILVFFYTKLGFAFAPYSFQMYFKCAHHLSLLCSKPKDKWPLVFLFANGFKENDTCTCILLENL